jgi:hypothetical protein
MTIHKLASSIRIGVHETADVEYEATLHYERIPGYLETREGPGSLAYCELVDVFVRMPGRDPWKLGPPCLIDALNVELQADMMRDWADDRERAAEHKAEQRSDDLMRERWA